MSLTCRSRAMGSVDFQNVLRDLHLKAEIRRDHVGQPSRIIQILDHHHHIRHQHFPEADDPLDLFFDGAHDGFRFEGGAGGLDVR